jgi:hypothetical protein
MVTLLITSKFLFSCLAKITANTCSPQDKKGNTTHALAFHILQTYRFGTCALSEFFFGIWEWSIGVIYTTTNINTYHGTP